MDKCILIAFIFIFSSQNLISGAVDFKPFDYKKLTDFLKTLEPYSKSYSIQRDGCDWMVHRDTAVLEGAGIYVGNDKKCSETCLKNRYKCGYGVSFHSTNSSTTCWLSNHHNTIPKKNHLLLVPTCPDFLNQTKRYWTRFENCVWYRRENSYVRTGLPREARTIEQCAAACQRNRRMCKYGVNWADKPGDYVHKCLITSDLPPIHFPGAVHLTHLCNNRYDEDYN